MQDFIRSIYNVSRYWENAIDEGFSAAVFLDRTTGQYTFAIRGTLEPVEDLFNADFRGIVVNGLAFQQIVDMYNYWQSLNTPNGWTYAAAVLKPISILDVGKYPSFNIITDNYSIPPQIYYLDTNVTQ